MPLSTSLDTAGPLARTIDDINLLDSIFADLPRDVPDRDLKSVRIGVAENIMAGAEAEKTQIVSGSLDALQKAGVTLTAVDLAPLRPLQTEAGQDVIDFEFEHAMTDYLAAYAPGIKLDDLVSQIASPAAKSFSRHCFRPCGFLGLDHGGQQAFGDIFPLFGV